MFKWIGRLVTLLFLLLALIGGITAWRWWRSQEVAEWLTGRLSVEEEASRTAAALTLVSASLRDLSTPNLYMFVSELDSRILSKDILSSKIPFNKPSAFSSLDIRLANLQTREGFLSLELDMVGALASPSIEFESEIYVDAAPAFDGSTIQLLPLSLRPTFRKVGIYGLEDREFLPEVFRLALAPLSKSIFSYVTRLSIPIELGFNEQLDLRAVVPRETDLRISNSEVPLRLAFSDLAMLPSPQGIHILGQARPIGEEEYEATVNVLRALSQELADMPPPEPCEQCDFALANFGDYLACFERSVRCRSERAFGGDSSSSRTLSPVELLVLNDLIKSNNAEGRSMSSRLGPLVAPRASTDALASWTPAGVNELFSRVQKEVVELAVALEAVESATEDVSHISVKNDLVASIINEMASGPGAILVDISVPDVEQNFDIKINTGPAPDLNCTENARACSSRFDYPAYKPRGCKSKCGTRNCWEIRIGPYKDKKCVNGIDLKCQARKLECESLKAKEKGAYEVAKAAAKAKWKIEKDACEVLKQLEKSGCELNQGWLEATQSMDVGRIKGRGRLHSSRASLSRVRVSVLPDLSKLTLDATVSGSTEVEASFVYTPFNAGHIACVAQWGDAVSASTSLKATDLHFEALLDRQSSGEGIELVFRLEESKALIGVSPSPGEALLTQAPGMILACPVPAAILGGIVTAEKVGIEIPVEIPLGEVVELPIPKQEFRIPIFTRPLAASRELAVNITVGSAVMRAELSNSDL